MNKLCSKILISLLWSPCIFDKEILNEIDINIHVILEKENSETKDEGNDNLELIPIMSAAVFLVILILTSVIVSKRRYV